MFLRLSRAHTLALAIWFLFRNMRTSTLVFLQHHWFSLRLQICKTCCCDLRSCYIHSQSPWCCQQELVSGCYSGSTRARTDNCRDEHLALHQILTTRSPAIPVSFWLPPYRRKTDVQDPPVASYMDHKTEALALRIAHIRWNIELWW